MPASLYFFIERDGLCTARSGRRSRQSERTVFFFFFNGSRLLRFDQLWHCSAFFSPELRLRSAPSSGVMSMCAASGPITHASPTRHPRVTPLAIFLGDPLLLCTQRRSFAFVQGHGGCTPHIWHKSGRQGQSVLPRRANRHLPVRPQHCHLQHRAEDPEVYSRDGEH